MSNCHPVKDLGFVTNAEVVERFVSLPGKYVIDVGCGSMTWTRQLSELGATVLAIDPDPIQADLNRAISPLPAIEFVETGADKLPAESGTVDGLFFSYSLHHIPAALYPGVFEEALRVLKPDGFLYAIEPSDCPINQVMKLFHNEDREREIAWQALETLAKSSFEFAEVVAYHSYSQYESFDDFATQFAGRSFNSLYTESDVRSESVQAAFERIGSPDYRFKSSKQVMYLRGPLRS